MFHPKQYHIAHVNVTCLSLTLWCTE